MTAVLSPIHYQQVSGHCGYWDDSLDNTKIYCGTQSWPRFNADGSTNVTSSALWGECYRTGFFGSVQPLTGGASVLSTIPQTCIIPPLALVVDAPPCPPAPIQTSTVSIQATSTVATYAFPTLSTSTFVSPSALALSATTTNAYNAPSQTTTPQAASFTATQTTNGGYNAPIQTTLPQAASNTTFQSIPVATTYAYPTQQASTCQITQSVAQNYCQQSIQQVPGCQTLCNVNSYIQNCVADVLSMCVLDFCSAYRDSYLQTCGHLAGLLTNHPDPQYAKLATTIQITIGSGVTDPMNPNAAVDTRIKQCANGKSGLNCDVIFDQSVVKGTDNYSSTCGSTAKPQAAAQSAYGYGSNASGNVNGNIGNWNVLGNSSTITHGTVADVGLLGLPVVTYTSSSDTPVNQPEMNSQKQVASSSEIFGVMLSTVIAFNFFTVAL